MIGDSRESINQHSSKTKIALRDALIVFLLVFITSLLAYGYPPTIECLYVALLSGLEVGIISYMHTLGIQKPKK